MKIKLPFKKTKHFNKMIKKEGKLLNSIRLTEDYIDFAFEFEKFEKENGETIGIDIGSKNVLSCSNNFQTDKGLDNIQKKISKKKKGSKSYKRALKERENFINYSINQLNLSKTRMVKRENIKNMKKGVRTSKFLTAWSYTEIFDKLERKCEEEGVLVQTVSPVYTSQRCSKCGWTQKSNRKGKVFKCKSCSYTMDADLNASLNIASNLKPIGKQERFLQKNRIGFYWIEESQESIVPDPLKTKVV